MLNKGLAVQLVETARDAAPPVTVVGMNIYGVSLPDIVSVATLAYLSIQIGYVIYKWRKEL